ncbi:MAG: tetratricopeptide repeat protein [Ectothiorhodospiraceae bacterium]|nr:tetratricopeptide repeat protein [Ectothiorhodospiraceae bacterium]MCH8504986.1 tetratricopeptide repeat protein [Ectothiorhodospiraceae bacterium]
MWKPFADRTCLPAARGIRRAGLVVAGCLALLALTACGTTGDPQATDQELEQRFAHAVDLIRQERHEDAAVLLERLGESHPGLPGIHVNLGIAHAELNRPEEAAGAWETALAIAPEHADAMALLAVHHRRQGRFEEARILYRRLLDAHPDHPVGNLNMGILCDLYLQDLGCALDRYLHYQTLADDEEMLRKVGFWIADLERRMSEEGRNR